MLTIAFGKKIQDPGPSLCVSPEKKQRTKVDNKFSLKYVVFDFSQRGIRLAIMT